MLVILRIQCPSERLRLLEWLAGGRPTAAGTPALRQWHVPTTNSTLPSRYLRNAARAATDFMCVSPLSKKALESSTSKWLAKCSAGRTDGRTAMRKGR